MWSVHYPVHCLAAEGCVFGCRHEWVWECAVQPVSNNTLCIVLLQKALCLVADVNECESARSNQCGHVCHDTLTSYKCVCNSGYRLMTDRHHCRGERATVWRRGSWLENHNWTLSVPAVCTHNSCLQSQALFSYSTQKLTHFKLTCIVVLRNHFCMTHLKRLPIYWIWFPSFFSMILPVIENDVLQLLSMEFGSWVKFPSVFEYVSPSYWVWNLVLETRFPMFWVWFPQSLSMIFPCWLRWFISPRRHWRVWGRAGVVQSGVWEHGRQLHLQVLRWLWEVCWRSYLQEGRQ